MALRAAALGKWERHNNKGLQMARKKTVKPLTVEDKIERLEAKLRGEAICGRNEINKSLSDLWDRLDALDSKLQSTQKASASVSDMTKKIERLDKNLTAWLTNLEIKVHGMREASASVVDVDKKLSDLLRRLGDLEGRYAETWTALRSVKAASQKDTEEMARRMESYLENFAKRISALEKKPTLTDAISINGSSYCCSFLPGDK